MSNATESQIKDRIAEFVQELDRLVRKNTFDALRGVLDSTARRGRPAGSGRGPGRPRASVGGDSSGAIVAFVQANDGQGVREIAVATGISPKIAKKVVAQLLASGALRKSGVRRGTVYHVGSGKAPRAKAGGRVVRKTKRAARPNRKAARKPALRRKAKKLIAIPVRRRPAAAPKAPVRAGTDVPQALAVG